MPSVEPAVSRSELEELYGRLYTKPDIDELARHFRNSGYVEKVTIGEVAAQGRVRGKRRDAGFNVRIHFSGTFSCRCPRAKKGPCEHVGALLLDVIARLGEASSSSAKGVSLNMNKSSPEVYKFLLDLFPGIGPKRANEVARVFRTVPDLLQATPRQLRNLPEIGTWAAKVLHEHLQDYQQFNTRFSPFAQKRVDSRDLRVEPDKEWVQEAPVPEPREDVADGKQPLTGQKILVQGTKAGVVFFRADDPRHPVMHRVIRHLRRTDRTAFRASRKHHLWVSDQERFPRLIGRLEALGATREHTHLVDVPLDGLTLFVDAAGRRARFQAPNAGLEELHPKALELIKAAEGYEHEEATGQHLVLPKSYPHLASELSDLGALLIRKRLRPMREIAEWKEEEPEDFKPGTPKIREAPDITPFMKEPLPEGLREHVVLRPYQREGVAFIRAVDYLAYLGDPPGLGKTIQAIVASLYLPGRVLVVAPAGARDVWKKEIESHTTQSVFVFRPTSKKVPKDEKFVVVSYDALLSRRDQVLTQPFDLVILDEAHYVKNKEAERTKAVHESLLAIPRRLLLSGTPVMNRTEEVRKQLEFIYPDEWGDEGWFRHRFVQPLEHGTPQVQHQVIQRLRDYFQGVMIRRQKTDVLSELPAKHVLVDRVRLDRTWRREYDAEAGRLREHVRTHQDSAFGDDYATTRGHVMTLRQIASNGKTEAAERYIRNILETKDENEKVVVFVYYLQHIESLKEALKEYNPVAVYGSVGDRERERSVKAFQNDDSCRVFLGQITAAGTALTLTAARHAVFVDLDWNPANHEQAGDRIHRISQDREVFLHYLVASNTIEEDIVKLLQAKSTTTSALLDGDEKSAGLLQQRRENRTVARLALKIAMGEATPLEK